MTEQTIAAPAGCRPGPLDPGTARAQRPVTGPVLPGPVTSPFALPSGVMHGDLEDWGPLAEATGDPMPTSGTWAHGDLEVGVWDVLVVNNCHMAPAF